MYVKWLKKVCIPCFQTQNCGVSACVGVRILRWQLKPLHVYVAHDVYRTDNSEAKMVDFITAGTQVSSSDDGHRQSTVDLYMYMLCRVILHV
jgi:hypothetical protein